MRGRIVGIWDLRLVDRDDAEPLSRLTTMQSLGLAEVNDLTPLAALTTLKRLDLRGCPVIQDQVEALQAALPNCKIEHDPFP